jgi:hypothetical protein
MWTRLMAFIAGPATAIAYCRAAQRDEGNGYEFTAAMKWRKSAELVAFVPFAADLCWKQWERIMHLPRRLSGPIVAAAQGAPTEGSGAHTSCA